MATLLKTPKGTASYPWLNTADSKFGDPTYKVNMVIPTSEASALVSKLEDMFDSFYASKLEETGKKEMRTEGMPWSADDNGNTVFKLKLNKDGKNKRTGETWENKIRFFDAKGRPVEVAPKIGGGSVLRVSFEPRLWDVNGKLGLKLSIKAVMIIDPKQGGGGAASADEFGFEAEEGGYEYKAEAFDGAEAGGDPEDF